MGKDKQTLFQRIPAVDRLLSDPAIEQLLQDNPRNLVLEAIHQVLEELRSGIKRDAIDAAESLPSPEALSSRVGQRLQCLSRPSLRPLINATGVVVHTNLGRSILAEQVLARLHSIGGGYSNLEYELEKGIRGSRYSHIVGILQELTNAEAALVVNNNAAAVLVALETLAKDREVVVSRGQLVEIGGSFRIPDVMRKSGARMVEVGTTNKTHLRDYEAAIGPETALLLKVHQSNFQIAGFTEQAPLKDLAELARPYGIPVMEDLGSGCLIDFPDQGLIEEPTVRATLAQGADLVTFSGDKLLGGPQAGIILGRRDLVQSISKNQLTRALRIDKLTLLALEETLRLYRDQATALREIPTLKMIFDPYAALVKKARRLCRRTGKLPTENFRLELVDGDSRTGGGALPDLKLPSRLLCLVPGKMSAGCIESRLRASDPPVIGRLEKDRVLLDVRTIKEQELKPVARAIRTLAETDQA